MKITICDDNSEDLSTIEKMMKKYLNTRPFIDYQMSKFSNPIKLYKEINDKNFADIYILDIIMSNATGIDIGKEIRKNNSDNTIIYITTSDDFALDAFNVHACRYLLKPIQESQFFEAMDYAVSCTKTKREPIYLVKTKDGLRSIPYSKIMYIENAARLLYIHMTDGEVITSIFIRKSFEKELEQLIENNQFIQVHKSYLINLNYIDKLNSSSIIMNNGDIIPVSRKNTANVKRQYLLFLSEQ